VLELSAAVLQMCASRRNIELHTGFGDVSCANNLIVALKYGFSTGEHRKDGEPFEISQSDVPLLEAALFFLAQERHDGGL
jgi:hypothetical protein